ncbi:MAG: TRAP transporter substrate-binding protein [Syntrophales bacterium]
MKTRLISVALSVFMALGLSAGDVLAKTRTIKISYNVAPGSSWDKGAQKFKEIIERNSKGEIKVETFPSAVLAQGNDRVEIEMAQSGVIDMLIKSTMWMPALDPRFSTIQMPFQFANHDVAEAVMDGPAGNMLLDLLPKHKLKGLAWGVNGFRQVTNGRREIRMPKDMEGLKIRVPGIDLSLAIFRKLGTTPVSMSFAEVFTALQTQTVDGQENPLSLIWSSRFFEVQKYCTLWNYMYDAVCFIASDKLWSSLNAAEREMFMKAAKEAMYHERQVVRGEDKTLVGELEKKGMKMTVLNPNELKAFQDVIRPVYVEFKGKLGQETVSVFEQEIAKAMKKK